MRFRTWMAVGIIAAGAAPVSAQVPATVTSQPSNADSRLRALYDGYASWDAR